VGGLNGWTCGRNVRHQVNERLGPSLSAKLVIYDVFGEDQTVREIESETAMGAVLWWSLCVLKTDTAQPMQSQHAMIAVGECEKS